MLNESGAGNWIRFFTADGTAENIIGSAREPITLHALLGKETLNVAGQEYSLTPGVIVPVDVHIMHHVRANPDLAILVTFFRQPGTESETTARFD